MKIVHAEWEKRNLGTDTIEITIERDDTIEKVSEVLKSLETEYCVIKVPQSDVKVGFLVQEYGFRYVESIISLVKRIKDEITLPPIFKRYSDLISIHKADSNELNDLLRDIESGDVFSTDRIAMDPKFGKEVSGKRYSNWIKDLLRNEECQINIGTYKNNNVAFGVLTHEGKTYDALLGGLLRDYSDSGLGFLSLYVNTKSSYDCGAKTVTTRVSSNNLAVLKLHMLYDYSITEIDSVYVKHF